MKARAAARPGRKRIPIDFALGEIGQYGVGLLFLLEALVQEAPVVAEFELSGESRRRAIRSDRGIPTDADQIARSGSE